VGKEGNNEELHELYRRKHSDANNLYTVLIKKLFGKQNFEEKDEAVRWCTIHTSVTCNTSTADHLFIL
jgi:hypothetical protein